MRELLLPYGFDTPEYSWVKATIGICTLADYSMAKKHQQNHIPKRVPECLMLRNHSTIAIIFSPVDFKKEAKWERHRRKVPPFNRPLQGEKIDKSSMRYVGTARYGYIDSFGKFEHGSTLVLSRISCIASGLTLLEGEQKMKIGRCVGAHKTLISCTNISSKCMK
jgi:hypothetical protein